jgi:hypothetical protein
MIKIDIKLKPIIRLIPIGKMSYTKNSKWYKFGLFFKWLCFEVEIDNEL